MSDFSDLCPLFNTGVYGEVVFPYISLSTNSSTEGIGGYIFGRSVIVTAAYVQKHTTIASSTDAFTIKLARAATYDASLTVFASYLISNTVTTQAVGELLAMTVTAQTFTATDVLLITTSTAPGATTAHQSVYVRFKEK